jgi:hypothetical protein
MIATSMQPAANCDSNSDPTRAPTAIAVASVNETLCDLNILRCARCKDLYSPAISEGDCSVPDSR